MYKLFYSNPTYLSKCANHVHVNMETQKVFWGLCV